MKTILDWMGEHPILTVILVILVAGAAVDVVRAIRGHDCPHEDK